MKRPEFLGILSPFPRAHPDDIPDEISYLFPIYSYLFPKRSRSLRINGFDQDKAFSVWTLSSAMEAYRSRPPQVNTEISDSLGRLSALPRELRDQIYSYVLPQGHTFFWREMQALRYFELVNHFESNSDTEDEEESTILEESNNALQSKDTLGSNLALLRLSKHIHEEATTFLYSQNIFGFFPSWRLPPSSPTWEPKSPPSATIVALRRLPKPIYEKVTNLLYSRNPFGLFPAWRAYSCGPSWKPDNLPSAAILDCITNVEFHLGPEMRFMSWCTDTDETLEFCRKKPTDSILPGPVALFTGTDTRRRSALIEIKPRNWSYYTTHITPSPLFAAIGQLTGFGKVTVRLHAHAPHFCPLEGLSDVEVRDCAQRGDWGMVFGGLMYMMEASRVRLERTLGRGVWGELVLSPSVETRHPKGWRDLVFWPGVEGVGMGVGG